MRKKIMLLGFYLVIVSVIILFFTTHAYAGRDNLARARQTGEQLLAACGKNPNPKYLSLRYDIKIHTKDAVRLKSYIILKMARLSDGNYQATFIMNAFKSDGLWSFLAMNVRGYYTRDYRNMMKSLNIVVKEKFKPGDFFRTINLRTCLKKKLYANQTPIGMDFGPKYIRFWQDINNRNLKPRTLPFTGQVGPVTGYFNFLLHHPIESGFHFRVINALNRVHDSGRLSANGMKIKTVKQIFEADTVSFKKNLKPCPKIPYRNLVDCSSNNLLDIIYGRISFNSIVKRNYNIPYAISVEGIISKEEQYRQEQAIRKLNESRGKIDTGEFAIKFKEIMHRNILSAWHIRCFLTHFEISCKRLKIVKE